jgi:CubicO group peptidase (beta-lactamase class C family)
MTKHPDWLAPALDYAQQWIAFQLRASEQPGCSLAVAHRGEIVLDTAFGQANVLTGEKLTPTHRFRVASHSKSFTATAIMRLREQGKLSLDDPAGKYVKGLHPAIAKATISQLLSHTAGIFRDGEDSAYWAGRAPFSNEAQLRKDLKLAPVIAANTRLKYSNHGFALAGLVIEAIGGMSYADFVMQEIVKPLGLRNTLPDVPLPKGAKLAGAHSGKLLLGRRQIFPGDQSTHALAAATGFISTASDLVRFFGQLDPSAPHSILSPESRREMTRTQWQDAYSPVQSGYGLGLMTGIASGWEYFGHGGGFQGYLTRTAAVPAHGIAASLLTNAADGLPQLLLDGVLHILATFQANGAPNPKLRDWTGRWWSVWGVSDLVPMGEKVMVALPGLALPFLKVGELTVTAKDKARISQNGSYGNYGEPASLVRDAKGKVIEVRLGSGRIVSEAALKREVARRYD